MTRFDLVGKQPIFSLFTLNNCPPVYNIQYHFNSYIFFLLSIFWQQQELYYFYGSLRAITHLNAVPSSCGVHTECYAIRYLNDLVMRQLIFRSCQLKAVSTQTGLFQPWDKLYLVTGITCCSGPCNSVMYMKSCQLIQCSLSSFLSYHFSP